MTAGRLTVVMYHYVRDLSRSRFPEIKGLTVDRFTSQLDYLARHHTFVTIEEVLAACRGEANLPPDAVLLTFDDGYADCYRYVFPILDERRLQGCFFPPVIAIRDRVVLDVNKIHFALAACGNAEAIAAHCLERITAWRGEYGLEAPEYYETHVARTSRFDDPQTLFVKDLLQRGLPEAPRARLVNEIFQRFVTDDETAFAEELYLTVDQIQVMRRAGMYFGAHGLTHCWLDSLAPDQQRRELAGSRVFLEELGYEPGQYVVSYPYGGYNDATVPVARELGYSLGFTVVARDAMIGHDDPLLLPRMDTTDIAHEG